MKQHRSEISEREIFPADWCFPCPPWPLPASRQVCLFACTAAAGISGQAWACSNLFLFVGFLLLPARDGGSGRRFRDCFRLPRFLSSTGRAPAGCIWFSGRARDTGTTPERRPYPVIIHQRTQDVRASIEHQARCYRQMAALWMALLNRQNCSWILATENTTGRLAMP